MSKSQLFGVDDEQWMTGGVDDEDDNYDGKLNPNLSLFNSSSTNLIFILLLLSSTIKDDGIGDIFRNTNPALRQTNLHEDDYDDNDDDQWVLTDGEYWFNILFIIEFPLPTSFIFSLFYFSLFVVPTHVYIQVRDSSPKEKEE